MNGFEGGRGVSRGMRGLKEKKNRLPDWAKPFMRLHSI